MSGKRGRPRNERWARLRGGFWRNDKVRRLSLEARGLLATAWSYAADQATDGRVPLELLHAWGGKRATKLLAELAPFITINDIDGICHDWLDHNISAAEYEATLEADRGRKRGGDFPGGNPPDIPVGNGPGNDTNFQSGALSSSSSLEEEMENPAAVTSSALGGTRTLVAFGDEIRAGTASAFAAEQLPAPHETRDLTWKGWAKTARWAREKARLEGADESAIAAQLVRGFMGSNRARKAGFPVAFLAQNPLEFWSEVA